MTLNNIICTLITSWYTEKSLDRIESAGTFSTMKERMTHDINVLIVYEA